MALFEFKHLMALLSIITGSQSVVQSDGQNQIVSTEKTLENPLKASTLYPRASQTREVVSLDGIWNFRVSSSNPEEGYQKGWHLQDLRKTGPVVPMPVPSSYNDVGEDSSLRDHVGVVWYERRFFVPSHWVGRRTWLRFSSVHYLTHVCINGRPVGFHEIGHLPFEAEISDFISYNSSNLLTVAVDNSLNGDTVPQGYTSDIHVNGSVIKTQDYTFDFFNYAGIHRSVHLYSTPNTYIDDINIKTDVQGHTGSIKYNVTYTGASENVHCLIKLYDKMDILINKTHYCEGLIEVHNATLWWPYLMNSNPGYLYTLEVSLLGRSKDLVDSYSLKVGIRTVSWTNTSVYINNKPLYLKGFGMHEDSDLRGKGWDPVLWVKNFNLIKWVGANAFRTSHYPYAEEIYQMADNLGIMIIDECPSVDTDIFGDALLKKHKQSLTDLIRRDKNHPSVIMWSIANEPRTNKQAAGPYFEKVVQHVKTMDTSRPVTLANAQRPDTCNAAQHLDVIAFNRYNGWYHDTGKLYLITQNVIEEAVQWKKYNKPVLMSEYGADTIAGLHLAPEYVWSEEYQVALMSEHFKAFDILRQQNFFVGELIWNFADFNTAQETGRVGGNKKGIFTRNRQPKQSAHHLRARYLALAATATGQPAPGPAYYVSDHLPMAREDL